MVNNYEIQKAVAAAKLIPKVKLVVAVMPHIAVMPAPVEEAAEEHKAE